MEWSALDCCLLYKVTIHSRPDSDHCYLHNTEPIMDGWGGQNPIKVEEGVQWENGGREQEIMIKIHYIHV